MPKTKITKLPFNYHNLRQPRPEDLKMFSCKKLLSRTSRMWGNFRSKKISSKHISSGWQRIQMIPRLQKP